MSSNKIALSFLAHPDDAEFLCAGTLALLAQRGWEVHIAVVAAGDCGTTKFSAEEIMAIRHREGQAAASVIGAKYHCLEERDGLVVYDKPALRKAIDLMREVNPAIVFTHAAKDYMLDHEMTSLIGRGASFIFGAPNASKLPLKPGAGIPALYYCDPIEGIDPYGNKVKPTTYIDITAVQPIKQKMLECHASQREWLREHHGMDEYIESMKRHDAMRGGAIGVAAAEAFVQHRGHAYPSEDVLLSILNQSRRNEGTKGRS